MTVSPEESPQGPVRNVAIVAHVDAGKTTTTEQLLYVCGRVRVPGSVDQGTAATDALPDERARGITIASAVVVLPWRGHRIHLVDTPGHSDFASTVERVLAAVDGAVLVVSAPDGVQPHTERLWSALTRLNTPTLIYVNKCDRPGVDFAAVIGELGALSADCVPVQAPCGDDGDFAGVLDLIRSARWSWPARDARVPERSADAVHPWRRALLEAVAERDEAALAAFARDGRIPPEALAAAVAALVHARAFIPVLFGASARGAGLQPLLDAMLDLLPAPPPADAACALSARVFHVTRDPRMGKGAYVRLYSGAVRPRDLVECSAAGWQAKVALVREADSVRPRDQPQVRAGEVAVLYGLGPVRAGDVLGEDPPAERLTPSLGLPHWVCTVQARGRGDLPAALLELAEEDPSLRVTVENGTVSVAVLGPVHQEVLASALRSRHGLEVTYGRPAPRYLQTIGTPCAGEAEATDAYDPRASLTLAVRMRPLPRGAGNRFDGAWPGVPQPCAEGVALEFETLMADRAQPLVDVALTLTSVAFTSARALRKLARRAVYRAVAAALEACERRIRLEPVLRFTALVPAPLLGGVLADIAAMRGRSDPPLPVRDGLWSRVEGEVPGAEAADYPVRFARRTRGQGAWEVHLHGYREI